MKLLHRNLKLIRYCLYNSKTPITDSEGFETSEEKIVYDTAAELLCSVSTARGNAQIEVFGNLDNYDKVLITDLMTCPIDENTVLFVDKEPEYDADGTPIYDYFVRRVAPSLNCISIAIAKVKTS